MPAFGDGGPIEYVLGISAFYHDSAAALLRDGEIVAAAQEERFTRRKGDARFPARAVDYCLREAGIGIGDLAAVGFYDKPLLKFERILETYLGVAPRGLASFLVAGPLWIKEKLYTDRRLRGALDFESEILYAEHHESHAASAFYPSPFEEAAILTMDGVGEWATASIGVGRGSEIELLQELHWPDSLGLLYSAFTYHAGFKVNSGEYKVMGLAPYGEPRYVQRILDELMDLREDGSFTLNQEYFGYLAGLRMTSRAFDRLFDGPPRRPESRITRREMDLARSVQAVCEEVMLRMARTAHRWTGLDALCLAGGVALNCVGNGRILRESPFEDLWIQPAAGDAGGALGVAQLVWHRRLAGERRVKRGEDGMKGAYLGPSFSPEEIRARLDSAGAAYERLERGPLLDRAAELLASGNVLGWFDGRMEFGPRALGSRSILADPRGPGMQRTLNLKIKFREGFRPFAPAVLAERAGEYFELDRPSPYMLLVAPVREERRIRRGDEEERRPELERLDVPRSEIPAVTHVDHSARIQTVRREDNPNYYDLIRAFERRTGCAVLVNTSFNVRGEPIVCTPEDAFACFMRTDMDGLVMGPFFLDKRGQPRPRREAAPGARGRRSASERRPGPSAVAGVEASEAPVAGTRGAPLTASEGRKFGLVVGSALVALGGVVRWRGHGAVAATLAGLGLLLIAAALTIPGRLGPVVRAWMALARAISRVTTPVLLGLVYFLVLTPVAVLRRLLAGNPVRHRATGGSYWVARGAERKSDLRRQF